MKTLKYFSFVLVLALVLSSCVVKSLHAFYTQDLIYFEQKIIGNWQDSEKANWSFKTFKEILLKMAQLKFLKFYLVFELIDSS